MKQTFKTLFYIIFAPIIILCFIGWCVSTLFRAAAQTVSDRARRRRAAFEVTQ